MAQSALHAANSFSGFRSFRKPESLKPEETIFSIQLNGDSLKQAAILNGDIVVCRKTSTLDFGGQLAAVRLPEGITVKFIWIDGETVILQGRNPKFPLLTFPLNQVEILGTAIRIERDLPFLK
ncbi:MAG TPA: S24 family peptidase [Blastocatellia bacterium]|nr:S24 family peptidase [Blastocatellia bacterium]HMV81813.1 S24 family peptidase [Blastocatellia bacterium]HMX24006.1 S24 family peptidase [Blastocatellia bacterium]HMY70436.1 S24 family peptidase [Blastocatellia bacterium]HMZ16501.1 S24 family peptidase [Blastocatellia bacterium]